MTTLTQYGHRLTRKLRKNKITTEYHSDGYYPWSEDVRVETTGNDAQFVSSQLKDSKKHLLLLDVGLPVQLRESKTPGHYHLIVDAPMTWRQYKRILRALTKGGVIEKSWAKASIRSGAGHIAATSEDRGGSDRWF